MPHIDNTRICPPSSLVTSNGSNMDSRILVTLGTATLSEEIVSKCSELGIYVFRINLSHTLIDSVEKTIQKMQSWTDVPVCLDSEGAQKLMMPLAL